MKSLCKDARMHVPLDQLPVGEWPAVWTAYYVIFTAEGKEYQLHTLVSAKGTRLPAVVRVQPGGWVQVLTEDELEKERQEAQA